MTFLLRPFAAFLPAKTNIIRTNQHFAILYARFRKSKIILPNLRHPSFFSTAYSCPASSYVWLYDSPKKALSKMTSTVNLPLRIYSIPKTRHTMSGKRKTFYGNLARSITTHIWGIDKTHSHFFMNGLASVGPTSDLWLIYRNNRLIRNEKCCLFHSIT